MLAVALKPHCSARQLLRLALPSLAALVHCSPGARSPGAPQRQRCPRPLCSWAVWASCRRPSCQRTRLALRSTFVPVWARYHAVFLLSHTGPFALPPAKGRRAARGSRRDAHGCLEARMRAAVVTVRRAAGGAASKRSVASAQVHAREPRAAHTWSTGARKPSHVLRRDVRQQAMSSTVLRLAKVCFPLRLHD